VCLPISAIFDDILSLNCSDSVVFKFVFHFIFNIRSRHDIAEILLKLALNTNQSSLEHIHYSNILFILGTVLSVLRFTVSEYPFVIFKHFSWTSNYKQFIIHTLQHKHVNFPFLVSMDYLNTHLSYNLYIVVYKDVLFMKTTLSN